MVLDQSIIVLKINMCEQRRQRKIFVVDKQTFRDKQITKMLRVKIDYLWK